MGSFYLSSSHFTSHVYGILHQLDIFTFLGQFVRRRRHDIAFQGSMTKTEVAVHMSMVQQLHSVTVLNRRCVKSPEVNHKQSQPRELSSEYINPLQQLFFHWVNRAVVGLSVFTSQGTETLLLHLWEGNGQVRAFIRTFPIWVQPCQSSIILILSQRSTGIFEPCL